MPSVEVLSKLADTLNIPSDYLLERTNTPFSKDKNKKIAEVLLDEIAKSGKTNDGFFGGMYDAHKMMCDIKARVYEFDFEVLLQFADVLKCSVDYILKKTDEKNPPADKAEGLGINIEDEQLKKEIKEIINIYISLDNTGRTLVMAKAIEEHRIQAAADAAKQTSETA
jgi:transcriptional regulator with XRE-family HTH domain